VPLYDYHCDHCEKTKEVFSSYEDRDGQYCLLCFSLMRRLFTVKAEMAFDPYYDSQLGEYIESRPQRKLLVEETYRRCVACEPPETRIDWMKSKGIYKD